MQAKFEISMKFKDMFDVDCSCQGLLGLLPRGLTYVWTTYFFSINLIHKDMLRFQGFPMMRIPLLLVTAMDEGMELSILPIVRYTPSDETRSIYSSINFSLTPP